MHLLGLLLFGKRMLSANEVIHALADEDLHGHVLETQRKPWNDVLDVPDQRHDVDFLLLANDCLEHALHDWLWLQSWQDKVQLRFEASEQPCVDVVRVEICKANWGVLNLEFLPQGISETIKGKLAC